MKKLLTIGLSILLGAAFLSGCGQTSGKTSATTSGAAVESQAASDKSADVGNTDEIFIWDGTVIKDLTEKGETMEDIVIPDTCTAIGRSAFKFAQMKSVVIGSGVAEIGDSSFYQCDKLESISFPASVQKIGKRAFYLCSSLKTITFSEGLLEIGEDAFGSTSCKTITFPESLVTFGDGIFAPCSTMEGVYIPASMENIPMGALGLAFDFGTIIYVKEGSWADLNFKEFIPEDPYEQVETYYEKAYY